MQNINREVFVVISITDNTVVMYNIQSGVFKEENVSDFVTGYKFNGCINE